MLCAAKAAMAKSRKLEETLAALHQLRAAPTSDAALAMLRRVLAGTSAPAVAKAAQIAGEFELAQLTGDLVAAFDHLIINPAKADPGCEAKMQVADALYRIGADDERLFLCGIHHRQMEPVYGGKVDTAAGLRGVCALALVRMHYPDALSELAELLADPEPTARSAAARAIAYTENEQAAALLRLKVLTGDTEPQVLSDCLTALLQLAPVAAVPFVARLLDTADVATQESAALALGASRLQAAFEVLRAWWDRTADNGLRRTALLAIAMLKHDAPIEFLLSLVAEAVGPTARDAIAALALYRHDDALCERVRHTAAARDDVDLSAAIAKSF
jgi:HEAT repeat protein